MEVTLDEMIKCAGRELGMRRNTYPRWVASGKMTQDKANHELACMESIYATLKDLDKRIQEEIAKQWPVK